MVSFPRPVYARKHFDIGWKDIIRAGRYTVRSQTSASEEAAVQDLEQLWAPSQTLVTLSVRSAFDLLLQACAFPIGSEIIVSAVTIPHMIAIAKLHGLVPVPVDLQESNSSVSAGDVEALITPRTKAILVAQLFGFRHSLVSVSGIAKKHDVLLIEDCAQAFCGLEFIGSPEATISMFSFGPIKTCTSLAGGITTVRAASLLEKMKILQAGYSLQKQRTFLKKVAKYAAFKNVTQSRHCYGTLIWVLRRGGRDHHAAITKLSHSLAADVDLLQQIRFRPSVALVELIRHRIYHFDPQTLQQRRKRIADIADRLPSGLQPVGYSEASDEKQVGCHYWICPILVQNPAFVLDCLFEAGFDAAAGNASLAVVSGPVTNLGDSGDETQTSQCRPHRAEQMMAEIIYLPVDNKFDTGAVDKLVKVLLDTQQKALEG